MAFGRNELMTIILCFLYSLIFATIAIALFFIKKRSNKPSRWKYPPTERIFQFVFSLWCFLGPAVFFPFIFGLMIMVSYQSWIRLLAILLVFTGITVSGISIFRPKFTKYIFLNFFILVIVNYIDSPTRIKKTTYIDICNELRNDEHCNEEKTLFQCSSQSAKGERRIAKTSCINNTGENSDYRFVDFKDSMKGKTFVTKIPLLYERNLPRNQCFNRSCGFKIDTHLEDFRNSCGNCLDEKRLDTKIRLSYVPVGTQFTVVDSFQILDNGFSTSSTPLNFLMVQDEFGNKAEISKTRFEMRVIEGRRNWDQELEELVSRKLQQIKNQGHLEELYCLSTQFDKSEQLLIKFQPMRYSKFIEFRIQNFIDSFQISNEIKINGLTILHQVPSPLLCARVRYKTEEAYLLKHFYFQEWGLYSKDLLENNPSIGLIIPLDENKTHFTKDMLPNYKRVTN